MTILDGFHFFLGRALFCFALIAALGVLWLIALLCVWIHFQWKKWRKK